VQSERGYREEYVRHWTRRRRMPESACLWANHEGPLARRYRTGVSVASQRREPGPSSDRRRVLATPERWEKHRRRWGCRAEGRRSLGLMCPGAVSSGLNRYRRRHHRTFCNDVCARRWRTVCGRGRRCSKTPVGRASTGAWGGGPRGARTVV